MTVSENFLNDQRQAVAAALVAGGVKALDYTSESLTPPCAAVVPGQPYIAWPAATDPDPVPFGHVRLTFQVLILITRDAQKSMTSAMDRLIVKALQALDDFDVTQVSQPGVTIPLGGSKFFGSVITITTTTEEP